MIQLLYVADQNNNRVQKFTLSGISWQNLATGQGLNSLVILQAYFVTSEIYYFMLLTRTIISIKKLRLNRFVLFYLIGASGFSRRAVFIILSA